DDDGGVEDRDEGGDAVPQPAAQLLELLDGEPVLVLRRLGDHRAGDRLGVAAGPLDEVPGEQGVGGDGLAGGAHQRGAAAVLLEAAAVAAAALAAVGDDVEVA